MIQTQEAVTGFAYNPNNDINSDAHKNNPPTYGMPNCNDWWNDNNSGLKKKLYTALPKTFSDDFQEFFKTDNDGTLKDNVIKRIIKNDVETGVQPANNSIGDFSYSHLATAAGSMLSGLTTYPKIYAALQAAPIIQSLLLLMIYAFLPFALVFTSYRASAFITGSIIIFSVIFWSFIWHLVSFVDTTLMQALYTDSWFSQHTPAAILADMITATLILIAPLFWFSFMGAMGVAVGDVVMNAFSRMSSVGDSVAKEGSNLVKTVSTKAITKGISKL